MIEGAVSSKLSPQVKLTLVGAGGQEVEIEADIDTKFNSGVSLPTELVRSLGWIFHQQIGVTLGDGSEPLMDYYRGIVMWHGQIRLVNALAAEATPLIGTELLDGNEVTIQFKRGGTITIAPLP